MKRNKYFLALMAVLINFGVTTAGNTVQVHLNDTTLSLITEGQDVDLPIMLESTIDMTSFQCDVYLPDGISMSLVKGSIASDSHVFTRSTKDSYTRIICYSPTKEVFSNRNGDVIILHLHISGNVGVGNYPISLKNIYLSDTGKPAKGYEVPNVNSTLNIVKRTIVESLSLQGTTISVGNSAQLEAIITPTNAFNKKLVWSSSNESVATVDENGVVTGHNEGSSTITATTTDGTNLSATCTVTVNFYISFVDSKVEALCVKNWDKNKDGLLSLSEAKAVTDIKSIFAHNTTIISFEELQYFTGLKSLPNYAFDGCTSLQSIKLPNTIKTIGESVFYGCPIVSITIPASVTSIGNSVFSSCTELEEIVVEEGNTIYDSRNNCNALIKTSTNALIKGCVNTIIPNTVVSIESSAFYNCAGLARIQIPSSVITIKSSAFTGCSGLNSIIVEEGNTVYDSRNGCNAIIETNENSLVLGCKNTIIPQGVTDIASSAFSGCSGLMTIAIPNSVTSIGASAFYGCI